MPATQRFHGLSDRLARAMRVLFLASLAGVIPGLAPAASLPVLDPNRVVVSEVVIQGSRLIPAEMIKNQMKTRVGKEFVAGQLQVDVCELFATRQFANVWADKQEDGPHRVKIFLYIRDLPSMVQKITYKGNINLSNSDLDEITKVRKGMPLNPIANKVACRSIIQRYNEDGRPFASCVLLKGGEAGGAEIVFNIHEGPKIHVRDIQFTGNTFASAAVLKHCVDNSRLSIGLSWPGSYSPAVDEDDVQNLVKYYRSFGYLDVKVSRELVYSGDGQEVTLLFHIQEGIRYRAAETPQVIGVNRVSPEDLETFEIMKRGEFCEEGTITKDTNLIISRHGYSGRETFTSPETVWSEDQGVHVEYEVVETNPAPTVKVLDNPADLDQAVEDVLTSVHAANTGPLMFGVGVHADSGLAGWIRLNERISDLFRPSSPPTPAPSERR